MQYSYIDTAPFDLISDESIIKHLFEDEFYDIEDARIYINSAVSYMERLTYIALRSKEVTVVTEANTGYIYLPFAPINMDEVKYINADNIETSYNLTKTYLTGINPKKLILTEGIGAKSITVKYSVTPSANLPENLKGAVLILIGQLYESRTIEATPMMQNNMKLILGDLIQINHP